MRNFTVDRIFYLTQDASGFPAGAVFAEVKGDIYAANPGTFNINALPAGLTLWRDHWHFFCCRTQPKLGHHFKAVMDAPVKTIRGTPL